jgi:hypothetical protein
MEHIAGKVDEEILVIYIHLSVLNLLSRSCRQDRTVLVSDFICMRMDASVSSDDTVAAE